MVHDDIDARLAAVAAQLSYPGGADALRALMAGVSAAPAALDPLGWTDLAGSGLSADQRQDLETLRRRLLAWPDTGGPDTGGPDTGGSKTGGGGRVAVGGNVEMPAEERIPALRAELADRGIDGFIVPRADEHQGEAVPARSERLAWLTGFSGSAGIAVVLAESAALFVDGRYTLQGRQQTDPALIACCPIAEQRPEAWITGKVGQGARIGFDPWLHTVNQIRRIESALADADIELVPVEPNPVDQIWTPRPPAPIAPVRRHPTSLAGRDVADKLGELTATLAAARADCVFLSAPDSIAWLFNLRGGDVPNTPVTLAFAEVRADGGATLFLDARKLPLDVAAELADMAAIRTPLDIDVRLDALAAEGRRVMLDPDQDPVRFDKRLRDGGATVIHQRDPCAVPKARKTAAEIGGARKAHIRDGVAVCRFLAWIDGQDPDAGKITEMSAAERLGAFRRETDGYDGPSFDTISGVGPNGAIVHYRVTPETSRPFASGTLYLVDSGGQYFDGTTDITRTVALGTPSEAMKRHYTLVLKGHLALAALRFPPGTTGTQIDALARQALWAQGLDYDHGTGHGIGSYLSVHEGPQRIAKTGGTAPLETGMIISNEPGLYIEGAYGIRIETLIAVTPPEHLEGGLRPMHGFETLTLVPYDRDLIDIGLVSAAERTQIDAYHARVRETLAPVIEDAETRAWLTQATLPL